MKKIVSLIVCMLFLGTTFCFADELNLAQLRLRGDIKNYLQQEGYMPEIDSDGDIKFKKEGDTFYVKINASDTSPMYVVLSKGFTNPKGYTPEAIKLAAAELNFYKAIKVLCYQSSISLRAEMYITSADAFKGVFDKLMKQIGYVEDDIMEELEKASKVSVSSSSMVPFMVTKCDVAVVDYNGNIITDFGATIYDYKTKYLKPRITVTPMGGDSKYTVYVRLYKDGVLQTGSSSPAGYTFSDEITISGTNSQTFQLTGWGSNTSGFWKMGKYRYEVWYGEYCVGSKDFTIY